MENDKELLIKLLLESNSYAEVLKKLGKSNSGAATKLLKLTLDDLNITHHFLNEKQYKIGQIIPL